MSDDLSGDMLAPSWPNLVYCKLSIMTSQANPKDMDQIFSAIDWRIQGCKADEQKRKDSEASDQVQNPFC